MTKIIVLDTERLHLRQWTPADRAPFAALNADARVMEFYPATLDRAQSDALADRLQARIAEQGWGFWAVGLKDTGAFIGFVGLQVPSAELPFSPCVEIGWRLAFAHWGRGYATEAAEAVLRVGFEWLGLAEIVVMTALSNRRSRAVMQRLGMREDAATFEHPLVAASSGLREHCLYRLQREQWSAR